MHHINFRKTCKIRNKRIINVQGSSVLTGKLLSAPDEKLAFTRKLAVMESWCLGKVAKLQNPNFCTFT